MGETKHNHFEKPAPNSNVTRSPIKINEVFVNKAIWNVQGDNHILPAVYFFELA